MLTSVPGGVGEGSKGLDADCGCAGTSLPTKRQAERTAAGRRLPAPTRGPVRRNVDRLPPGDRSRVSFDYTLTRVVDEPEAGVATCVVIEPLNGESQEVPSDEGPRCRTAFGRTGELGEFGPMGLPDAIPPGGHGFRLPAAYRVLYPSTEYPFDDPAAEWIYLRSGNDPARCNFYSSAEVPVVQDDLIAIAVIPYLTYEVLSSGYLDTPAGYRRPQIQVRFVLGMIISVQNLDGALRATPQLDEGGRIVELFNRVSEVEADLATFRREDGEWRGVSRRRRYDTCVPPRTLCSSFSLQATTRRCRQTLTKTRLVAALRRRGC